MTEEVKDSREPIPETDSDMPGEINPVEEPAGSEEEAIQPEPEQPILSATPEPSAAPPEISDFRDYSRSPLMPSPEKKKTTKGRKSAVLLTILLMAPLMAVIFIAGILIGGEYGISSKKVDVAKIPFAETVKQAIEQMTEIPLTLTITEQQINDTVLQSKNEFAPLKNMNVSVKNNACTVSGQIPVSDAKTLMGDSVPEMLYLFLPETLNLKADFEIDKENPDSLKVKEISILNMEKSDEFINGLGIQPYLESLVKEKLTASVPPYMKITSFQIENGKILCNASLNILRD